MWLAFAALALLAGALAVGGAVTAKKTEAKRSTGAAIAIRNRLTIPVDEPLPAGQTEASRFYVAKMIPLLRGDVDLRPRDPFKYRKYLAGEAPGPGWTAVGGGIYRGRWLDLQVRSEFELATQLALETFETGGWFTAMDPEHWSKLGKAALAPVAAVLDSAAGAARNPDLVLELRFAAEQARELFGLYTATFAGLPKPDLEVRLARAQAWVAGAWEQMEEYGSYVAGAVISVALAGGAALGALTGTVAIIGTAAGPAFLAATSAFALYMLSRGIADVLAGSHGSPRVKALRRPIPGELDAPFGEDAWERYVHRLWRAVVLDRERAE